jgi:PAS domain S-box-containing protein
MTITNISLSDPDRISVVHDWGAIWLETQTAFVRTANLAARVMGLPIGFVTLVGQRSYRIVGSHGLALRDDRRPLPELLELIWPNGFVQISDPLALAKLSLMLGENFKHRLPAQPGEIAWQDADQQISIPVGFFASVPLLHRDGHVLGCLAVVGNSACTFGLEEVSMLEDLAESLSSELDARAQDAIWREGRVPSGAEANLLGIIESSNEAIISESLDGTVKSWNGAAERLLGYSAKEAIGRNITFIIPGGNEVNVRAHLARLEAGQRIEPFETHRLHASGHEIPVRVSMSPIINSEGRVIGASSFTIDISRERQTLERLDHTTARLRSVVTELPVTVFAVDNRGIFTLCEGKGLQHLSLNAEDLVGRSCFTVLEPNQSALKAVRRALEGERFRTVIDWDGAILECTFSPLLDGGRLIGASAVALDITDHNRNLQHLHLLNSSMASVSEPVMITDSDLEAPGPRIVYANPAFCEMCGYSLHELLGRTPRLLQGPATDQGLLEELRKALKAGENFQGNTINYRKDGTPYEVEWRISPVLDDSARITHFAATQRDITERKRVEKLLRELAFFTNSVSEAGTFENPIELTHYDLPLPVEDLEANLGRLRNLMESQTGLRGRLEDTGGAGGLVQMLSLVRPSGLLRIDQTEMWLRAGRVVHVKHPTLQGRTAVLEAFSVRRGQFHFDTYAADVKATVNLDPAKLVIEAAIREAELVGRATMF